MIIVFYLYLITGNIVKIIYSICKLFNKILLTYPQ